MFQSAPDISNLPDLTHPHELMQFGGQLLSTFLILTVLIGAFGIILAGLSFSLRREPLNSSSWTGKWLKRYDFLLRGLQHSLVILLILVFGFFLCSTLANRYHHWEQAKVAKIAQSVAGERIEQPAPQVRYQIEETYTYKNYIDGKYVDVQEKRKVDRFMALAGSQIEVKINQTQDPASDRALYRVDFTADYKVVNRLNEPQQFFLEMRPPYGYSLLQNFRVERDGQRLEAINPGDFGFPFKLDPGQEANFQVAYQAQGASRWVYNANGQLLSNFRLTTVANFPQADFASGIIPTETAIEGPATRYTWVFQDNVSVQNPFGVFTATNRVRNTGILPRLLLLAPALFLWWLILLYLSVPMQIKDVAIASGVFFACLLTLTYLSRSFNPALTWTLISLILLVLAWGLGTNRHQAWGAIVATLAGAILPVFGLLVPYSGLTLSVAALLSVTWLSVLHWFGGYKLPNSAKS